MGATDSDIQLLDRYTRLGDQQAFAAIVQRHADLVYAACLRVLGDGARAEEVAQETFFQLVKKAQTVNQSLAGWLHRTATHLAIDVLRSDVSRIRRERGCALTSSQRKEDAAWREVAPHVDDALSQLPESTRELLVAHFLEGKTQTQLAQCYGVSRPTIHRRIQAGLNGMRSRLRRMGVLAGAGVVLLVFENTAQAAPSVLMRELGKIAMVSGQVKAAGVMAAAGEVIKQSAPMTLVGVGATAAVVCIVLIGVSVNRQWQAPTGDFPPTPVIMSELNQLSPAPALTADPVSPPRYIMLERSGGSIASDEIIMFQDPATRENETILLTFGDGHVQSTPLNEAQQLIENQTGQTVQQLIQSRPAAAFQP